MNAPELNVDREEIAKFEALAHRWWDTDGDFKPLHDLNPLRLGYIDERAALDGKSVLDVGCGGGILSEAMWTLGAQVTGIDMADEPLNVARLHLLESGCEIDYLKRDAESMADDHPESVDVVTCMELLEHVPDPASMVDACARLVRPGGHLFFSTINRNPKAFLLAIVGAEYVLNMLPRGTHEYAKFIKPSELDTWGRSAGLELGHLAGMEYNPLTREYSLSSNVSVNYLMHFTRPGGTSAAGTSVR